MVYDDTDSKIMASCALVVCLLVVCDIASSARSDYEGHFIQPDVQTHWGAWEVLNGVKRVLLQMDFINRLCHA